MYVHTCMHTCTRKCTTHAMAYSVFKNLTEMYTKKRRKQSCTLETESTQ